MYLQVERRYSKHTIAAYRNDISQLQLFLDAQKISAGEDLTELQHRHIRSWIMQMMSDGMKPKSVHRKVSSIRTYCRYLLKKGVISKNPMSKVVVPKMGKALPLFIEEKGVERMFEQINNSYPEETDVQSFEKFRDVLIVDLLYTTGIRRSELIGLKEESIDRSQSILKVLGKGNKERLLPLSEETLHRLDAYLKCKHALFGSSASLFLTASGKAIYPNLVYRLIHSAMGTATTLSRKSPHIMRHTFATHLSNNGAELNAVKELLGHASLASTQVYTHNSIDKLKEIYRKAHPKGG